METHKDLHQNLISKKQTQDATFNKDKNNPRQTNLETFVSENVFSNYTVVQKRKMVQSIIDIHFEIINYKKSRTILINKSKHLSETMKLYLIKELQRETLVQSVLRLMKSEYSHLIHRVFINRHKTEDESINFYSKSTYYKILNSALTQFLGYYYA